ncbi:DUF764 family protein (plasmid) [Borrelia miyamotoi]|uniref:DUF764 family protein n=1 Tax=Borrelia miyamotoi TaxID=47466 RepID=A0AAX3JP18_9SPIR|nr:DUF764 family protein [Borrelia miyamotoi]QFP42353.1 DUF764 family protein [Borrelia miyamotoi]QFP48473.1 DUF764 family protein [Borrelia miyamotoi]WAZ72373.1 DUF764 family protein [Borrelia miyamotoi]
MLVNLYESQTFLTEILIQFKNYLRSRTLRMDVINSYNGLYLSDLKKGRYLGLIVMKPEGFDCLEPRSLRSGSFYENVNEFCLKFKLYLLGFVNDIGKLKIYDTLHKVYEYLLEFLHENFYKFEFKKPLGDKYELVLNYYIKATSDMVNGGFVNVSCVGLRSVLGLIQSFRANIQAIEIKN